jgi:hypothetical protein
MALVLPAGLSLCTAKDRPDLYEHLHSPTHPLNLPWPLYIQSTKAGLHYWPFLSQIEFFAQYQMLVVAKEGGQEVVVASGSSIPFYWERAADPDSEELPDSGWDGIQEVGAEGYFPVGGVPEQIDISHGLLKGEPRLKPNALAALQITVAPELRGKGVADFLLQQMKVNAVTSGFQALVVPVRPTRKSEHPFVDFVTYLSWKKDTPGGENGREPEVFDPWVRKHIRMGGKIIKICWSAATVIGSAAKWKE